MGPAGLTQLQEMFARFINISVGLSFIALTGVLIYGGIRFLTSGGEPNNIKAASLAVTWGLLGILFLVLAWLILKLIEIFTGVPVTKFCLGFNCP